MKKRDRVYSISNDYTLFKQRTGSVTVGSGSSSRLCVIIGLTLLSVVLVAGSTTGLVVYFVTSNQAPSLDNVDNGIEYPLDLGKCGLSASATSSILPSSSSSSSLSSTLPVILKSKRKMRSRNTKNSSNNMMIVGRIINGENAEDNGWPWMVSLRRINNNRVGGHFCGGSLIYSQYVITAAHCVVNLTAKQVAAVVGTNSLANLGNTYYAIEIANHENFSNHRITNDLAIIKLNKPIELSTKVNTICMPNSTADSLEIIGKRTILTGWQELFFVLIYVYL